MSRKKNPPFCLNCQTYTAIPLGAHIQPYPVDRDRMFCSLRCAAQWAVRRVDASNGNKVNARSAQP